MQNGGHYSRLIFVFLFCVSGAAFGAEVTSDHMESSQAAAIPPQAQYEQILRELKVTRERLNRLEKSMEHGLTAGPPADAPIDLKSLDSSESQGSSSPTASTANNPHRSLGPGTISPDFRVYFDLSLINRPGIEDLSFDSYHTFLFFEYSPTPAVQFSFDVSPTPRFFELDYNAGSRIQFRLGRIWIPFDDSSPHNIYGGRVNISRLAVPGNPAFLPDIWADMGVGIKVLWVDNTSLSLNTHLYVVNGFQDGGRDPLGGAVYPLFSDVPYQDNNRDKAIGGRAHAVVLGKFGLGASFYTDQYTSEKNAFKKRMFLFGLDGQIRIAQSELRVGLLSGNVQLATADAGRGGFYVEFGQKFGSLREWKALARAGLVQFDDRVLTNNTDQTIVGGALLWKPGLFQYELEHSRDLKLTPTKTNYSYTAASIVMAF